MASATTAAQPEFNAPFSKKGSVSFLAVSKGYIRISVSLSARAASSIPGNLEANWRLAWQPAMATNTMSCRCREEVLQSQNRVSTFDSSDFLPEGGYVVK